MDSNRLVCIGTVAMDVLQEVQELPGADGFAVIEKSSYLPGGSASNVVSQAAKLGADCAFVAKVGDDTVGKEILTAMEAEGIDTDACMVKDGGTSLHTTIVVDKQGDKFILLNMGDAFLDLRSSELPKHLLDDRHIFFTDLLPGEPALATLHRAADAGVKIAVNLQVGIPMMEQFGVSREEILSVLRRVHLFAPCREAAEQLSGSDDPADQVRFFRSYTAAAVVLTRGGDGAYGAVAHENTDSSAPPELVHVPAERIKAVDTTGAGDAYMGGLIHAALIRELPLREAMKIAGHCAAVTCTKVGARSGPTAAQIAEWADA